MRTSGVPERNITGDASDWDKFAAWAATVPQTLRNPLYHWTHLELKFPFGVSGKLLGPDTAQGDLRALQPQARRAGVLGAGAAGPVRREGRLQHRRSRRRSGAAPAPRQEHQGAHQALPDLASRQGAGAARSGRLERLDRQAGRRRRHRRPQPRQPARGAAEAARLLPRDRLPRVGSRPGAHLRGALHGGRGGGGLRRGARGQAAVARTRSRSCAPRSATTSR